VGGHIYNEQDEKELYYDDSSDSDKKEEEKEENNIKKNDNDDFINQFYKNENKNENQSNNKAENEKIEENIRSREENEEECSSGTNTPEVDKLAELVFRLSMFCCTEVFTDGQPSSSLLVYYSGVLGCTDDGSTFRRPRDYTPQLSALIYIQRLLLLEFALPYRTYTYVGLKRRPHCGQLERLNDVRLECMVFGSLTPLGEFQSLRAFGRKLARSDTPSFMVRWSDDGQILSYDDTTISMADFRNFGHSLIERVEALCDKLMFNWTPEVDLNRVKDDMSNTKEGYSFIQHPANDLAAAYLTLSTRACTARGDGLLKDGKWDSKAVSQYLKRTETIREEFLAMMYALCGQAPRATELLSIECCNGKSTERGVYVYNGFMVYVIRHHKAKKSTNKEFMVVRFLPAKAGKPLFYYLVYIRPFAAFLQRQAYMCSTGTSSSLLFCSNQEPTRLWRSNRLADILWKSSALVFKRPVNIRLYRQLSICITEKHVKILAKPFNRYDDHSANADPNVVFA
jgi:hypothetical protein